MIYKKFIDIKERIPELFQIVDIHVKGKGILRDYMLRREILCSQGLAYPITEGDYIFVPVESVLGMTIGLSRAYIIKLNDNLVTHWLFKL